MVNAGEVKRTNLVKLELPAGNRLAPHQFRDDSGEQIVVGLLPLKKARAKVVSLEKSRVSLISEIEGSVQMSVTGSESVRLVLYVNEKYIDFQQTLCDHQETFEGQERPFLKKITDCNQPIKVENAFMVKLRNPTFEVYIQCKNEEGRKVKISKFELNLEWILLD